MNKIYFFCNSTYKLTKNNLTINNINKISYNLKQILIKENPKEFEYLGYSTIKYTCKTKKESDWEINNPFG